MIPITGQGYQKLQKEIEEMKTSLQEVVKEIASAREHGDLKENSEYK